MSVQRDCSVYVSRGLTPGALLLCWWTRCPSWVSHIKSSVWVLWSGHSLPRGEHGSEPPDKEKDHVCFHTAARYINLKNAMKKSWHDPVVPRSPSSGWGRCCSWGSRSFPSRSSDPPETAAGRQTTQRPASPGTASRSRSEHTNASSFTLFLSQQVSKWQPRILELQRMLVNGAWFKIFNVKEKCSKHEWQETIYYSYNFHLVAFRAGAFSCVTWSSSGECLTCNMAEGSGQR